MLAILLFGSPRLWRIRICARSLRVNLLNDDRNRLLWYGQNFYFWEDIRNIRFMLLIEFR